MKVIEINSWEQYLAEVDKIKSYYNATVLFRGQSKDTWPLKPTLERFSKRKWTIREYCQLAINCVPEIESSENLWIPKNIQLPTILEIENEIDATFDKAIIRIPGPNKMAVMSRMFEFWIYLRHYGFPSPLLDWSRSPLIAAFFAFCDCLKTNKVAIFTYVDSITGDKYVWDGKPQITSIEYETEIERHNLQESCYTVATRVKNKEHEFADHEKVFGEVEDGQDILTKYILPSSERIKILQFLDREDINHFKLLRSEEAFLKTLAFRHLKLNNISHGGLGAKDA